MIVAHAARGSKTQNFAIYPLDAGKDPCYNEQAGSRGEMAERFKALVLKTSDIARYRGFESLSLRQFSSKSGVPLIFT